MLNVKLKLRQVEMDMLKLRSKHVEINNGKSNASSGFELQFCVSCFFELCNSVLCPTQRGFLPSITSVYSLCDLIMVVVFRLKMFKFEYHVLFAKFFERQLSSRVTRYFFHVLKSSQIRSLSSPGPLVYIEDKIIVLIDYPLLYQLLWTSPSLLLCLHLSLTSYLSVHVFQFSHFCYTCMLYT